MDPWPEKPKIETLNGGKEINEGKALDEQEETLIALIEYRTKEVDRLRNQISFFKSQMEAAEKKLQDSKSQLAFLRLQSHSIASKKSTTNSAAHVKVEQDELYIMESSKITGNTINDHENDLQRQIQSRPQLVIPAMDSQIAQPAKLTQEATKPLVSPSPMLLPKRNETHAPLPDQKVQAEIGIQRKGTKRKFEQREHSDLIPSIGSCLSPCIVRFHPVNLLSSQHKRKLRNIALNSVNSNLFVTSALDGIINLWEIQEKGSNASLLSTTDSLSPKTRRWPEDVAWHPLGNKLFSVYSADGGDFQISILDLNSSQKRVKFLEEKPHIKGVINNITFMPWPETCFATSGSDHSVIVWNENGDEDLWEPKILHGNIHSSAVMGVAGIQHKKLVLSVGSDKRIIGYDIIVGKQVLKHQIESKCLGVLPNPSDFNLFMVQTGAPQKQLRLFDVRLRQTEIHTFGWKQQSSESQSALINQTWSPDGWYITSGSADPIIHIFDIRYNSLNPSQSINAHQRRVFRAVWHHSYPLLISISSDLNIGLHSIL